MKVKVRRGSPVRKTVEIDSDAVVVRRGRDHVFIIDGEEVALSGVEYREYERELLAGKRRERLESLKMDYKES